MNERDPIRVGIAALVVIGLIGGVILVLSVVTFGTKDYTAVLEHTAGLRKGEDVEVHGVVSGKVKGIRIEDDHVRVDFALDADIDLGDRTSAAVKVATLLGTHYLEVSPGGTGSLAGGRIPLERTSVPYNLQDVIEQGSTKLGELDPELLAKALTAAADTLGPSQEEIGPALEGVARLSEVVSRRSDQIGALLTSTRRVTDQLSKSSDDIIGLMQQANLVLEEINARKESISRLLTETTALSKALSAVVDGTNGKIKPALDDVDKVLATLNSQRAQLQSLLDTMAPSMRYLANAAGDGPYVPLYLKPPALPGDDFFCKTEGRC